MSGTLSDAKIDDVLTTEIFGHLGCIDNGKPYVVPMAFVFQENVLYGQTTEGKKIEMLRKNPKVCFQVERHKDGKWQSVMCHGTFEELDFKDITRSDQLVAIELLTKRIASIQKNVGVQVPYSYEKGTTPLTLNGKQSTLFRILIEEKSGRAYGD
jgi:nitroimidazol reductase NimA-like FMN-containing flavoprotein (pyridoxamine 5'-phosphate oxidase superfamily)